MKNHNCLTIVLLLLLFANVNHSIAQAGFKRLRALPYEVINAELIGEDLYISGADGLYYSNLDTINFRRIVTGSISNLKSVGNKVYFGRRTIQTLTPSYCNGDALVHREFISSNSAEKNNVRSFNSLYHEHFGLSTNGISNGGIEITHNNYAYSRLFKRGGHPTFILSGNPVALDPDGQGLGSIDVPYSNFASDGEFFYGVLNSRLYRSASPILDNAEIIIPNGENFDFGSIFYVNNQLVNRTGNYIYISEDQGLTWEKDVYLHEDLRYVGFSEGQYFFTDATTKLRLSTESWASINYDTIYNFLQDPYFTDRKFISLDSTTFLASKPGSLQISYDKCQTWNDINTGFWESNEATPAVTNDAVFFKNEEGLLITLDEGLTYEKIEPSFETLSGNFLTSKPEYELFGFQNNLFGIISLEDGTRRLYMSLDHGVLFKEIFDESFQSFYQGESSVFARVNNELFHSIDKGENWLPFDRPELENNLNNLRSIEQYANLVLIEFSNFGRQYLISYDNGETFNELSIPDERFGTISLVNGKLITINNIGETWIKANEASDWAITNEKPSYFNNNGTIYQTSASKIFAIGDYIYSVFGKTGQIDEYCNSLQLNRLHYSDDFGRSWRETNLPGNESFHNNGIHYRYNDGFFKFDSESNLINNQLPDLSYTVLLDNLKPSHTVGDSIIITFQGENFTHSDIDEAMFVEIMLYNKRGTSTLSDTLHFDNFESGEAFTYETFIPIDSSFTFGKHHLTFKLDLNDAVLEGEEENNNFNFEFNIEPLETITSFVNLILCQGDYFNDQLIETDTSIIDTVGNVSLVEIITSNIFVLPSYKQTIATTFCEGSSILYNDIEYDLAGIFLVDNLLTVTGCDSLIFLNVTIQENFIDTINLKLEKENFLDSIQVFQDTIITQIFEAVNGCDSTLVYDIEVPIIIGVNNQQAEQSYDLYPNPFTDKINIKAKSDNRIHRFEVFDLKGRKLMQLDNLDTNNTQELDLSDFVSGIYIINCWDESGRHVFRVVKK